MANWLEQDVIDPLIQDVADPVLNVLKNAAAAGITGAAEALGLYKPAAGTASTGAASTTALGSIGTGIQAAVDALITELCGEIPIVGALIAPEIVALGNEALQDLESKAGTLLQSLISAAITKLTGSAAPAAQS